MTEQAAADPLDDVLTAESVGGTEDEHHDTGDPDAGRAGNDAGDPGDRGDAVDPADDPAMPDASSPLVDPSAPAFEPAALQTRAPSTSTPPAGALSLLHDVDMEVTVELGRTTMPIRELLALQPGMVVEIERDAGAPIDVLVNGRLIACGEVVVIDEEFGIRITEICDPGTR